MQIINSDLYKINMEDDMLFSQIRPFVRYARALNVGGTQDCHTLVARDARLFCSVRGIGRIECCGNVFRMTPGSVLILNSGIPYRLYGEGEDATYLALNFDFTDRRADLRVPIVPLPEPEYTPAHRLEEVCFEDAEEFSRPVYLADAGQTEPLAAIVGEYSRRVLYWEQKTGAILSGILIDCLRRLRAGNGAGANERTERILAYLHEHYRENVTNRELGQRFGFHPNHVSLLIRTYTGMPLHQYLIHVRLTRAMELLDEGRDSIGQISEESGFGDVYYFSKYFKRATGMTPSEYRKGAVKNAQNP